MAKASAVEIIGVLTSALPEYTWRVTYVPPSDPFVIVVAYDKLGKAHFLRLTLAIIDGSMHFGKCGSISLADPQSLEEVHDILKHCMQTEIHSYQTGLDPKEFYAERLGSARRGCETCRFAVRDSSRS